VSHTHVLSFAYSSTSLTRIRSSNIIVPLTRIRSSINIIISNKPLVVWSKSVEGVWGLVVVVI
jgi:hypothetical protein